MIGPKKNVFKQKEQFSMITKVWKFISPSNKLDLRSRSVLLIQIESRI